MYEEYPSNTPLYIITSLFFLLPTSPLSGGEYLIIVFLYNLFPQSIEVKENG